VPVICGLFCNPRDASAVRLLQLGGTAALASKLRRQGEDAGGALVLLDPRGRVSAVARPPGSRMEDGPYDVACAGPGRHHRSARAQRGPYLDRSAADNCRYVSAVRAEKLPGTGWLSASPAIVRLCRLVSWPIATEGLAGRLVATVHWVSCGGAARGRRDGTLRRACEEHTPHLRHLASSEHSCRAP
jgi:hypothetical protein